MNIVSILRVTQLYRLGAVEMDVAVDEYVPLRFRTYRQPLGVGYVRLGDFSRTLIELAVEPETQAVRGLTVTSISEVSSWPAFEVFEVEEGLPALTTSFVGGEVVDLPRDFKVSTRPGEIVVFWQDLGQCRGYRFGSTFFLIADGTLAGAWFTGMTEMQTQLFESQAESP